jgi:NAD(P)H-flavin reductase/ferredoxin
MPNITLGEHTFSSQDNETVLDTLLRANQRVPYSCKQGICQACLMRCLDKTPPVLSQVDLKDTLKAQQYFLACLCIASEDMHVAQPYQQGLLINAQVIEKQRLAPAIMRLSLRYDAPLRFFAGQFTNLQRSDGLTRSYSIANLANAQKQLEFHIRLLPNGQFSQWLFNECAVGDSLKLSTPQGNCYYLAGQAKQPLLLIGTGTGLAPLYGILRDALQQGHTGKIHLFHGSRERDGLYLVDELRQLATEFSQFTYSPCVSAQNASATLLHGRASDIAFKHYPQLQGWRVYLCGNPDMVKNAQKTAYLQGASLKDIYSDEFVATQR